MKKTIYLLILILTTLINSACSFYNIKSEETAFDYYPPKQSKNEVAYVEKISQPFEVIGQITVNAERNQKFDDMIEKMRTEAAVLGGDAITNITTDVGTGKWAKVKPKQVFGNSNIRINYHADVIVFK